MYEKCGSIPLSRAKRKVEMVRACSADEDDRLPKIALFGQLFRAKRKVGRPRLGWKDVIKKDLKEIGTSWEDVKREALNRLGWRRSVRSCFELKWLGTVVSC